ncbi:hypothetical protein AA313_de0205508 [Arthrobotrys entomopaga]|nr:hypothetical protein AA313_de0205508 [Arthrobotrys entomopaga]
MKNPEKAAEKKQEIKRQMVRRSRRRKKNNQDAGNINPEVLSRLQQPTPTKPPTLLLPNLKPAKEAAFQRPANQFPTISLPVGLGDHEFSTFSTSSPEDSGITELLASNMQSVNWGANLPRSQRQSTGTLSPPTTATLPSRGSTRGPSSVEDSLKRDDEDDDIEDVYSEESPPSTEVIPYGSRNSSIPYFDFPDLQIQADSKLDVSLANLYLRTIFGVTYRALSDEQVFQYNDALIVPMFINNSSFLHGCLSSTALHLTATNVSETNRKALVTEVYRHRQKSLNSLKNQIAKSSDAAERIKIAATVCALISFEVFSRRTDWQVHVKAATDCVILLDWCRNQPNHPGQWFIYSRILWLDILSSLTTGINPVFSSFYREIMFYPPETRNRVNRLYEMTGCEDSVLYLISEITCLENWKTENIQSQPWSVVHAELVRRARIHDRELKRLAVTDLSSRNPCRAEQYKYWNYNSVNTSPQGDDIDYAESELGKDLGDDFDDDFGDDHDVIQDGEDGLEFDDDLSYDEDPTPEISEVVDGIVRRHSSFNVLDSHSVQSPKSPTEAGAGDMFVTESTNKLIEDRATFRKAVTEAFRIMARVYLRIVVHGFNPFDIECQSLLKELLAVIDFIPSLYMGYERSIISPLLIVGSCAVNPQHQNIISTRLKKLPHMAKYGNLGNVDKILTEIWSRKWMPDPRNIMPWRQVMKEKNWEYLMV